MADTNWKRFERYVAKEIFNSVRNIGSGAINSKDDGTPRTGDVIHDTFEVECKCYKKITIFRWWEKVRDEGKASGKIPVLVMKELGNNKDILVAMNYKTFIEMKEAWERSGVKKR